MTYLKSIQVENEVGDIISPNTEQSTEMLLEGILKELRRLNLQMSILTDTILGDEDIIDN